MSNQIFKFQDFLKGKIQPPVMAIDHYFNYRYHSVFGYAWVTEQKKDARGHGCHCEVFDETDTQIAAIDFDSYEQALAYAYQFELNAALYSMQGAADRYVQTVTPKDPQCPQREVFAKRELRQDAKGNLLFKINGQPMPMRSSEECIALIKQRLAQKAAQQGYLDFSEKLWTSHMAALVSHQYFQQYCPQVNETQMKSVGHYMGEGYRDAHRFLEGGPIDETKLLATIQDIFNICELMQPIGDEIMLHRGIRNQRKTARLISTATNLNSAGDFYKGAVMHLRIPQGTPMLWASGVFGTQAFGFKESEVILPPMQFQKVSSQTNNDVIEWQLSDPQLFDVGTLILSKLDALPPTPTVLEARAWVVQRQQQLSPANATEVREK